MVNSSKRDSIEFTWHAILWRLLLTILLLMVLAGSSLTVSHTIVTQSNTQAVPAFNDTGLGALNMPR